MNHTIEKLAKFTVYTLIAVIIVTVLAWIITAVFLYGLGGFIAPTHQGMMWGPGMWWIMPVIAIITVIVIITLIYLFYEILSPTPQYEH